MKNYQIVYKETLIHTFNVEANSEAEAKVVFEEKLAYGEFDFSDGEIDTTEFSIKEDEIMKTYNFKVCFGEGRHADGLYSVQAENEDMAYDIALQYGI